MMYIPLSRAAALRAVGTAPGLPLDGDVCRFSVRGFSGGWWTYTM